MIGGTVPNNASTVVGSEGNLAVKISSDMHAAATIKLTPKIRIGLLLWLLTLTPC